MQEEELKAKMERNHQKAQQRQKERALDRQLQEQQAQLDSLKAVLKEKEQLNRVSTYKLNELRRVGKVEKLNIG